MSEKKAGLFHALFDLIFLEDPIQNIGQDLSYIFLTFLQSVIRVYILLGTKGEYTEHIRCYSKYCFFGCVFSSLVKRMGILLKI